MKENNLTTYAKFFTSTSFKRDSMENNTDKLKKCLEKYNSELITEPLTVGDYYTYMYHTLRNEYRIEYIIKNELLNFVRKNFAPICKVYNELTVYDKFADLVVVTRNKAICFEIKTEYDTEARLNNQLARYKQVFDNIYVVIPKSKLGYYEKLIVDDAIGIIVYDIPSMIFYVYRDPHYCIGAFNHAVIMTMLHKKEYARLAKEIGYGDMIEECINSFSLYAECLESFYNLPVGSFQKKMVEILYDRIEEPTYMKRYPELDYICAGIKMTSKERWKIEDYLNSNLTASYGYCVPL